MATHRDAPSEEQLAQAWAARLASGTFSKGVLGVGTIRVMGKSGDTPLTWPRIESLDALGALEPDEQWAVRVAERIVREARTQDRTVHAVAPAEGLDTPPQPTRVTTFDPSANSLVVVSAIRGG